MVQADVIAQAATMAMIPAAVLLVLGPGTLGSAAFPMFFALLAVPAGDFLMPPMMDITATGSVFLLGLSGVPVFRDGWLISIPEGNFQVAEACSGVRYLIGATTTGLLFGYLFFKSWKKRIIFIAFTVFLTVMANVFRAYIIILLARLTDMRLAVGVDHFIYGWLLFSLMLLVVFSVGFRFADLPFGAPVSADAGAFRTVVSSRWPLHVLAAGVGFAVLIVGPFLLVPFVGGHDGPVARFPVPEDAAGAHLAGRGARPGWLKADVGWQMQHLSYRGGSADFELHLFWGGNSPGGDDLSTLRQQLDDDSVTLVSESDASMPTLAGEIPWREMRLQYGSQSLLVAYWFTVGQQRTANPVTAKMMEVRRIMMGEYKRPALIAVVLDINKLDHPGDSLRAMLVDLSARLSSCLEQEAAQTDSVAEVRCRMVTTVGDTQG
jgi:EpsI family protein